MAKDLRGSWKETGTSLGHAFRDLGKTLIKTGATAAKKVDKWVPLKGSRGGWIGSGKWKDNFQFSIVHSTALSPRADEQCSPLRRRNQATFLYTRVAATPLQKGGFFTGHFRKR